MAKIKLNKTIEIREIRPKVFNAIFKNQYMATATFMRISEFYESPFRDIKNSYFSLEEYMDHYAGKNGNFTYHTDWAGFNVPGKKVTKFFNVFGRKLLEKEKIIYKKLKKMVPKENWENGDFYLIGTWRKGDVKHEIAHAYYYLHRKYKIAMNRLIKKYKYQEDLKKYLISEGYSSPVLNDECQSYLATSTRKYMLNDMKFQEKWCERKVIMPFKHFFRDFDREMICQNSEKLKFSLQEG